MDKYIFAKVSPDKKELAIQFQTPSDVTIAELLYICKRFAYALGYSESDIETYFGGYDVPI